MVRLKIAGASPERASPYSARELVYRSELAADQADVKRQALIMDGRAVIPARWILYRKGVYQSRIYQ